jgi:undecaprenyl-phosphate galactose phosphotransferase
MNVNETQINIETNLVTTSLVPKQAYMYKSKARAIAEKVSKRTLDIFGGIAGCLMLIPITIIVAISKVINKEKGPIFYSQKRIGKDGKLFKMYKFRSMVVGADEILEKYLAENKEAAEEYRINKKLKDDPRITKTGKFIRRTSLDEFPQFINVLKGDMSLVGPRPYLPREKEDMGNYYTYITECKPGVTGLWQVSGRSDCTFNKRLNLDYEYYADKSFKNDCKILIKTVENVVKKEGAV